MSNNRPFPSEATDFVLRALEQSSQPLGVTKLNKAIPKSAPFQKKQLPELLEQMAESNQIRAHHQAKSITYWLPAHEKQACARILEALDEKPLTQTELRNKFKSLLIGWPQKKRAELVERLIKEKRVYKLPPLTGKSVSFSVAPANPRDYLQKPISELADRIKKLAGQLTEAGVEPAQLFSAAHDLWRRALPVGFDQKQALPANFDQLILDGMERRATTDPLVSLSELRRDLAFAIPDKGDFDRAVLRLAEAGRVVLHRHDYPTGLSQPERDALVSDERGNYFIGVTKV